MNIETGYKIIKNKVGLLKLSETLGNISHGEQQAGQHFTPVAAPGFDCQEDEQGLNAFGP